MVGSPPSLTRRVPAGALALVLVISIVISAILLGLIGLYAASYRQIQVQRCQAQVQRNARSGLAYVLAAPTLPYFQPQALDLFDLGTDSVVVSKRPWGLFEVAVVVAGQGAARDTLAALVGSRLGSTGRAALYVPNSSSYPLGLAGRSQLRGDAYLPERGARAVYVPGQRESAPAQLVTGTVHLSAPQLPISVDSALRCVQAYATQTLSSWLPAATVVVRRLPTQRHSFLAPPLLWQQGRAGALANVELSGQIILLSPYPLVLEASAHLDGVLVLAPKITVREGFRGRVQLFARDTIEVQARCQLNYPSAIGVFGSAGTPAILLREYTFVAGTVVAGAPASSMVIPLIQMHATTQIQGQVYTNGTVLNCGQVVGSVMCQRLVYQYRPGDSRYDNYLVNAVIDRLSLPPDFLSSCWLNPTAGRGVIQWLL